MRWDPEAETQPELPGLPMIAAPARVGRWLDTDVPLSDVVLEAVRAAGYVGVFRYLPLPGNSARYDISAGELARTIAADLQCGLVQHCRRGLIDALGQDRGIDASEHDGEQDGRVAALAAAAAGYSASCHLFLDLENLGRSTTAAVIAYADAWAYAVRLAGNYAAGLYVGFAVPLTPEQLYNLPGFDTYWSDAGHRHVATRGCAIVQGHEVTIAGVTFDEDYVAPDLLGGLPMVASPDVSTPTLPRVLA